MTAKAGCAGDFDAERRSPFDWPILRLLTGDSSISARMARRSSVAEMTGKRITSMHPRANRHWTAVNRRAAGVLLQLRHSK